jgi:hypothetical protein
MPTLAQTAPPLVSNRPTGALSEAEMTATTETPF